MEGIDPSAVFGIGGAAVVSALVEGIKRLLALEDTIWMRVVPLACILAAIGWTFLVVAAGWVGPQSTLSVIATGILTGLAASGLYSGQKATRGN